MSHDLDTLRNQLLSCQQRSIKLDQARIDAESQARQAVADKRRPDLHRAANPFTD